jgi:hypothetical protein
MVQAMALITIRNQMVSLDTKFPAGCCTLVVIVFLALGCQQQGDPPRQEKEAAAATAVSDSTLVTSDASAPDTASEAPHQQSLSPLPIVLPAPAFRGTPKPLDEPNVEEPLGKPRPPFLAPQGAVNLALGRRVTASDPAPSAGELDFVTDGAKEASDFGYLQLQPDSQWVQIDLQSRCTIYAVLVWHNHADARVYRDVVVQVSDDPDFLTARTVFNNDFDNSSGLGIGFDKGYVETAEGKLIDCKGVEARYVRLFSSGNHMDDKNHYTEVEVFGVPSA